jgi:hypothetical protein
MVLTGIRGPRRDAPREQEANTGHRPSWPCLYCPRLRRIVAGCYADAVADYRLALAVFDATFDAVRR